MGFAKIITMDPFVIMIWVIAVQQLINPSNWVIGEVIIKNTPVSAALVSVILSVTTSISSIMDEMYGY